MLLTWLFQRSANWFVIALSPFSAHRQFRWGRTKQYVMNSCKTQTQAAQKGLFWDERRGKERSGTNLSCTTSPIIICVILAAKCLQDPHALIWQEILLSRNLILGLWSLQLKQPEVTVGKTNNIFHFPSEGLGDRQVWRRWELPAITFFFSVDTLWEQSFSAATYTWKSHASFLWEGWELTPVPLVLHPRLWL